MDHLPLRGKVCHAFQRLRYLDLAEPMKGGQFYVSCKLDHVCALHADFS